MNYISQLTDEDIKELITLFYTENFQDISTKIVDNELFIMNQNSYLLRLRNDKIQCYKSPDIDIAYHTPQKVYRLYMIQKFGENYISDLANFFVDIKHYQDKVYEAESALIRAKHQLEDAKILAEQQKQILVNWKDKNSDFFSESNFPNTNPKLTLNNL